MAQNFQRPWLMRPPTRVLVPVDLESVVWEPLEVAGWLAAQAGAIADLLYVLPESHSLNPSWQRAHEELLSVLVLLTERFSLRAQESGNEKEPVFVGNMQPGDPADLICDFADRGGHDVIVMGSNGRFGDAAPARGGVIEQVLRQAQSPVLVVPTSPADDLGGPPAYAF